MNILATIGRPFVKSYFKIGDFGKFFIFQIMLFPKFLKPPFRIKLILKHIESMGVMSLGVVSLTGLFTGMVLAIQMYFGFHKFGAESVMGFTIFYSVGRELGPVFTTLMLISKAVSAMSAELGTMRVTEQIDAIDILSIDSKKYLIVPRIIAMVFATPLLILVFDMIANIGAYVMAVHALDVNPTLYIQFITQHAKIADFATGLVKGLVFGYVISAIGTYVGYFAHGGAKGVGEATTKAVVIASVSLFLANYFTSSVFLLLNW